MILLKRCFFSPRLTPALSPASTSPSTAARWQKEAAQGADHNIGRPTSSPIFPLVGPITIITSPLNFNITLKSAQIILGKDRQEVLQQVEGGIIPSGLTQRELLSTVYTKRGRT